MPRRNRNVRRAHAKNQASDRRPGKHKRTDPYSRAQADWKHGRRAA